MSADTPAPHPMSASQPKPRGIAALIQRFRAFAREHMLPLILGGLIFTFLVVYLANRIFILIGPGEAGVLFHRLTNGTDTRRVYGEGMSIIAPWNKMFIYNVRVQERANVVEALSSNGLTITVSVSLRYYPDYSNLGILHQKVGPDYAEKVVIPEVTAGVREVIGRYRPEELYTLKTSAISEAIIQNVVRAVSDKFIVLDDVNIKNIKLPALVTTAIENKLQQEQMAQEYEFRLKREEEEAKRLLTQAGGIAAFNEKVNQSLTEDLLRFKGIEATLELSKSPNSKVVVIGSGADGLPLILNPDGAPAATPAR
ncbi:prohibitin family protein [Opitutaceae bacterium]